MQVEVDVAGSILARPADRSGLARIDPGDRRSRRPRCRSLAGPPFSSASNPGRLSRPLVPLIPSSRNGHDGPAKPSSGLLERLQLVLDGLASITGRDPDIEGGASGQCCHSKRVSRIGSSSSKRDWMARFARHHQFPACSPTTATRQIPIVVHPKEVSKGDRA